MQAQILPWTWSYARYLHALGIWDVDKLLVCGGRKGGVFLDDCIFQAFQIGRIHSNSPQVLFPEKGQMTHKSKHI